jgi:hypothetical protein
MSRDKTVDGRPGITGGYDTVLRVCGGAPQDHPLLVPLVLGHYQERPWA